MVTLFSQVAVVAAPVHAYAQASTSHGVPVPVPAVLITNLPTILEQSSVA